MMSGYLLFLALILNGLMAPVMEVTSSGEPPATYKYDRIDEVKKNCESALSSASEFKLDSKKIHDIKEELSFMNGDWEQQAGDYPLLPFDNSNSDYYTSPSKLVSFWVTDVERDHRSLKSANVNGILVLSISQYQTFFDKTFASRPRFQIWPGQSELLILFQGIYTESESDGGKKVMCLLGNALLPERDPHSGDPWQRVKNSGRDQSFLSEDDQILLVLQYPLTFALTNREIQGEMRSLNPESNPKFFDKVAISSQLTNPEYYDFSSERIVSRAADDGFKDAKLSMQNVKREPAALEGFGPWKPSGGQLCMVGSVGHADAEGYGCYIRICMGYSRSYLSLQTVVQPSQLWHYFRNSRPTYEYTKSDAAPVCWSRENK